MEYKESGVVESVTPKAGFQSIKFKNRGEYFSNWLNKGKSNEHKPLSKGDIIDYNFDTKGKYHNITNFQIVTSTNKPSSPEPSYNSADTVKDKETDSIKSKIKEITISRGQTVQFAQYEPTNFHVSAKAEYDPSDNPEKVCSIVTDIVETELARQIINERERRKE